MRKRIHRQKERDNKQKLEKQREEKNRKKRDYRHKLKLKHSNNDLVSEEVELKDVFGSRTNKHRALKKNER